MGLTGDTYVRGLRGESAGGLGFTVDSCGFTVCGFGFAVADAFPDGSVGVTAGCGEAEPSGVPLDAGMVMAGCGSAGAALTGCVSARPTPNVVHPSAPATIQAVLVFNCGMVPSLLRRR
jgi:hypothetical protein